MKNKAKTLKNKIKFRLELIEKTKTEIKNLEKELESERKKSKQETK